MLNRLAEGTILRDRYRLTGIVGKGGMGNVYRAEDLRLPGRLCAIKEVRPESSASPELRRQEQNQFLREASLLAQLDHPNLPKVSDFFTEGGNDYLVMDFVPGSNLKELVDESRMQRKMLTVDVVLEWASQLLDAVAYLHRQDPAILHRDIKPSNIKLTPDGRIKLVDFGLAKVLAGDSSSTITVIQGRGTAFYTPLEQYGAESEHTDIRSDLYAIGATLYHLLSSQPPPEAKARFLNPNVLVPVDRVNPAVSRKTAESITWAMEMHPDDRPESVLVFRQALLENGRVPTRKPAATQGSNFLEAIRANAILAILALGLFVVAVLLTVL